ncbi:MAG: glycine zipper 2TM domain-containing protein [Rhodospirillales bacterium]|nr:glycine zipper 2TM domain-containing protein [Rhodospirillales bacterium]MCB9995249.1 glycine zipper 2TM domain-containing protein [Rhodospirillales bacterium]
MRKLVLTGFVALAMGLTGCQTDNWGSKQTMGTGAGAVLGGLAGSQVGSGSGRLWATGAGVLLGALMGSEVGASLDRADRMYMQQAQGRAHTAPVGETIAWNNPESGNHGTYTVQRDGTSTAGRYCREYQQTVYVGGQKESAYGTACQQPDGSWEIVN